MAKKTKLIKLNDKFITAVVFLLVLSGGCIAVRVIISEGMKIMQTICS